LLITGGCCHDYDKQKVILTEGIASRANVKWTIVQEGGTTTNHRISLYEKADWADAFDVIVHNECFSAITDEEFVERVCAAHRAGKPGVMLHCSMHTFRDVQSDRWRECLGVTTRRHEKQHLLDVKTIKSAHPIMQGFPAVWKTGDEELYMVEKLWTTAEPLAQAFGVDTQKDHVCVWTNSYGKGRIFGSTLVHHAHHMERPEYLDLITRGLLWSCNKLDASGKPVAGYGPVAAK